MAAIYSQAELLSIEECEIIARRAVGDDFEKVIDCVIECPSKDAVGFLGVYFNLTISIKDKHGNTTKHKFFIKTLPIHEKIQREYLEKTGIFEKEAMTYKKILNNIKKYCKIKWFPICYYSRPDIIVLENLKEQGYHHVPDKTPFTIQHIKSNLRNLATMHASSIAYEVRNGINIGEKYSDLLLELTITPQIEWFLNGIRAVQDATLRHPKYQSVEHQYFVKNKFTKNIEPIYEIVNPSPKFRNTFCHRDSWGKNVLFKPDNTSSTGLTSCIVDFQICRYCPPAVDVLFCIYMNTRRAFRDSILEECLDWYYNCLQTELNNLGILPKDQISKKEFLESCEAVRLMPVVYSGIAATLIHLPEGLLTKLKTENPEKFNSHVNVNRSEIVLEQLEENEEFRSILFETVEEIMETIYTKE